MTTYLLAGGGTAGHVNPLLAVADRIQEREPDARILVLGTKEGLEARLVPQRGYELLTIPRLPFPRKLNAAALRFPRRFLRAVAQTRGYLTEYGVDAVVGFGGYACPPGYLAAWQEKIPLAVHEANAKPGIANRLGSLLSRFVGTTFRRTKLRHGRLVGMPLRAEIERLDKTAARAEALRFFDLDPGKPVLLVTGGSSGARRINTTVSAAVPLILGAGWQVLHITGAKAPVEDPQLAGYHLMPYCDRMELALAVADLAVSRSGAATVTELAALGTPAIFVPYPVGNGEQRFNAQDMVSAGGARLVLDAEFTPDWVSSELVPLLRRRDRIADMAARAATVGVRDGADRMADLVAEAVGRRVG
ncbi:undecaprenyldiphospho-muramoylpentapeptide beta-N-acetylglucosaminyltransferase [Salinibacterium sp. ZJ450]|uniref:undecaprenyldiphospho-muramoylpentapeptide beta-N-acetylglucosaminyltransferase n=1 Tax=Salinibacterium sp. ZJ450 TaxID=2708338 RepID=UPI00141EC666|nr:undecaprenyldiphospho-muramoylpentapeptide beta-N-acetylglucosaminyltransferase [Salinibacterium sp. ZJ450]